MKNGMIDVPGARLYYETRGSGPVFLILQGGDGDAARTADLVERLADEYTMVTYDRRGLSRSLIDEQAPPLTLETHADDAARLLAEVAGEPAIVLGSSFGALIGMHLAAHRPELVKVLIAHEPPALDLLPDDMRAHVESALDDAEQAFREHGGHPALMKLAVLNGINFAAMELEPGVAIPAPTPERAANIRFFFAAEVPAFRRYRLDPADLAALKCGPSVIVPAGGEDSRGIWGHVASERLAGELGVELAEFPKGHSALTTHPTAFAARIRDVLAAQGVR